MHNSLLGTLTNFFPHLKATLLEHGPAQSLQEPCSPKFSGVGSRRDQSCLENMSLTIPFGAVLLLSSREPESFTCQEGPSMLRPRPTC